MSRLLTAASLGQALAALAEPNVKVLAGGTDLMIALRKARLEGGPKPDVLLDATRIPELRRLSLTGPEPFVGAAVTFHELESDPSARELYPALALAAASVGSAQIRRAGTLGGNAANASPAADGVCALTMLGARALLASRRGTRLLGLDGLIAAPYVNTLADDELIVGFYLDAPARPSGQAFAKVGRRQAVAVARLNLAASLDPDMAAPRLVLGACFPSPRRLEAVESFLAAEGASEAAFAEAGRMAAREFIRVCGRRSSAVYKVPAIEALTARTLARAWGRLGGVQ